jgi:hypothetical protein
MVPVDSVADEPVPVIPMDNPDSRFDAIAVMRISFGLTPNKRKDR